MSGAGGVSIARSRGENRFYNPPPLRKLQQQQQQQQAASQPRVPKPTIARTPAEKRADHEECATAPSSSSTSSISSNRNAAETNSCNGDASNLDRFVQHTTLSVPVQHLPRTGVRGLRTREPDAYPYFVLGDLWESLKEWSAYGAGVPILLNGTDSVIQYYCPYLSGIQLYIDPSRPHLRQRGSAEEGDLESSREASNDDSGESGSLRRVDPVVQGSRSNQTTADSNIQVLNRLSLSNGSVTGSSDESEISHAPGQLIFQYMEHELPYGREPLADKISVLASQFPALKTYRSCDLSPSSWISVAWYPIYRIPMGPTLKNLEACFLTYHYLSTPLPSKGRNGFSFNGSSVWESHDAKICPKLRLPTFGLAFYKFKVEFWNHDGGYECQKASSYLQAADNWLQNLQVHHPDFGFFVSHNSYPKPRR